MQKVALIDICKMNKMRYLLLAFRGKALGCLKKAFTSSH